MFIFTPRIQSSVALLPLPVGVFEDDALLLSLAARSRLIDATSPHPCDSINADEVAFQMARLTDYATWDF